MITVYTGLPGSGKTTRLARTLYQTLMQNKRDFDKYQILRPIYTNIKLMPHVEDRFSDFINYFTDIYQLPNWRQCDIFIDELAVYFDAHDWERLPNNIKAYLRLHRHYNVNIYAVAQDFLTIDRSFRRLVKELYAMDRICGTREPSLIRPVKRPFIFSLQRLVDPKHYELEKEHYQYLQTWYNLFTKKDFSIFDTTQDLPEQPLPPLRKRVRIFPGDDETKPFKQVKYI